MPILHIFLTPLGFEMLRCVGQALAVPATKFSPWMSRDAEMLAKLKDSLHIRLVIPLVLRVDGIEFP